LLNFSLNCSGTGLATDLEPRQKDLWHFRIDEMREKAYFAVFGV
jgi:hypothetical protein